MPNDYLEFEKPVAELERRIEELHHYVEAGHGDLQPELEALRQKCRKMLEEIFGRLTPWQKVQLSRHPQRPSPMDYISHLFTDFLEFHGDRLFADDPAIVAGAAAFQGRTVFLVGHRKGRSTREKLACNFGMPHPEGYRKALRVTRLAEKFRCPVITFIDTPGAFPGMGAEERGQAEAIARNLMEMARLRVPIVSVVTGEGGSGGALAIGVADRLLMLEHAVYSVISPEGCAAILWKGGPENNAPAQAAEAMKMTAQDLLRFGIADEIVPEPLGGAHRDPAAAAERLGAVLARHLRELETLPVEDLLARRYEKYRRMGVFRSGATD